MCHVVLHFSSSGSSDLVFFIIPLEVHTVEQDFWWELLCVINGFVSSLSVCPRVDSQYECTLSPSLFLSGVDFFFSFALRPSTLSLAP